ncbi:MAG TPA: TerB family tellurite resistance protein [Burkholderiaceae bacterium]|nr:TerB family tellurite resistance protein [Burkholderiaceae bacterium]
MLRNLKELFAALQPLPQPAQAAEHTLQLATAVMLIEVMRADPGFGAAERQAVVRALHAKFALADDEVERLVELGERAVRESTDWFEYTSHINARFDMAAKIRMVELMWGVAFADGRLSDHERHTLWRLSDLLHVPQGAYVHAKMRAREAAGLPAEFPAAGRDS